MLYDICEVDFDPEFYGRYHKDLNNFTTVELIDHYKNWGKKEGRKICSDQLWYKNIKNS